MKNISRAGLRGAGKGSESDLLREHHGLICRLEHKSGDLQGQGRKTLPVNHEVMKDRLISAEVTF